MSIYDYCPDMYHSYNGVFEPIFDDEYTIDKYYPRFKGKTKEEAHERLMIYLRAGLKFHEKEIERMKTLIAKHDNDRS